MVQAARDQSSKVSNVPAVVCVPVGQNVSVVSDSIGKEANARIVKRLAGENIGGLVKRRSVASGGKAAVISRDSVDVSVQDTSSDERICSSIAANNDSITRVAADAIRVEDISVSASEPVFPTSAVSVAETVRQDIIIPAAALVAGKAMQRKIVGLYFDVFSEICLLKSWRLRRDMSFDEVIAWLAVFREQSRHGLIAGIPDVEVIDALNDNVEKLWKELLTKYPLFQKTGIHVLD